MYKERLQNHNVTNYNVNSENITFRISIVRKNIGKLSDWYKDLVLCKWGSSTSTCLCKCKTRVFLLYIMLIFTEV